MDTATNSEKFEMKIQNLYSNEKKLENELRILFMKTVPDELKTFFQWAFVENHIAIDNLNKIMSRLMIAERETTDTIFNSTITGLNATLLTHREDENSMQKAISIYYHSLAGYQVKMFSGALAVSVEAGNSYSSELLSECLNNKVEIKKAIQVLENKIIKQNKTEVHPAAGSLVSSPAEPIRAAI
jgi:ferritin-like metal-binding protein YciE